MVAEMSAVLRHGLGQGRREGRPGAQENTFSLRYLLYGAGGINKVRHKFTRYYPSKQQSHNE